MQSLKLITSKFLSLWPEIFILCISIIFILFGSLNYPISPAPPNVNDITRYKGQVFCLPVTSIDSTTTNISESMNYAYQLMMTSIILGVVLFVLSIYMILIKCKSIKK